MKKYSQGESRERLVKFLEEVTEAVEAPDEAAEEFPELIADIEAAAADLSLDPAVTSRLSQCLNINGLALVPPDELPKIVVAVIDTIASLSFPNWPGFGFTAGHRTDSGKWINLEYKSPEQASRPTEKPEIESDQCRQSRTATEFPLHDAIDKVDIKKIRKLLATGIDVNAFDEDGNTSLHAAVFAGDQEIVELLLDHGADINARSLAWGDTPLHVATMHGNADIVLLLINRGADLNARANNAATPLGTCKHEPNNAIRKLLSLLGGVD